MAVYTFQFAFSSVQENAPRFLWRNILIDATPALETLANEMTYNNASLPTSIEFDFANPVACNAIGICGALWSGQVISVDYDDDNTGWKNLGAWQGLNDSALLAVFNYQTSKKWRIQTTGAALNACVLKFGMSLAIPRNQYGNFSFFTKNYSINPDSQLGAHFVGKQIELSRRSAKYDYKNLNALWVRAFLKPMLIDTPRRSVFCAWRSDDYVSEVIYGWLQKPIKLTNQGTRDYMSAAFSVEGFTK